MKRRREKDETPRKLAKHNHSVLCKRKIDAPEAYAKRVRTECDPEKDFLRRKNFELEQMVQALIHKVNTLEYMLKLFQNNETIQNNKLITAF